MRPSQRPSAEERRDGLAEGPIVVPLDGSALGRRALPYAQAIAQTRGCGLVLVQAVPGRGAVPAAAADLEAEAAQPRQNGVAVQVVAQPGTPAEVILGTAPAASAIVMSTYGRGGAGRALFGSVADSVLRHTHVPVLLITGACAHPWTTHRPQQIVVALDGSELATEALPPAAQLARAFDASLLLLNALPPEVAYSAWQLYPYVDVDVEAQLATARAWLDQLAAPLTAAGLRVETRAELGHPAAAIVRAAGKGAAGIDTRAGGDRRMPGSAAIAMATHGRSGLARFVLGSVAATVVGRAAVPVLLVRPAWVRHAPAPGPPATARCLQDRD